MDEALGGRAHCGLYVAARSHHLLRRVCHGGFSALRRACEHCCR